MMQVLSVASGVPTSALPTVLAALAEALVQSPHLEFVLDFVKAICTVHGGSLQVSSVLLCVPLVAHSYLPSRHMSWASVQLVPLMSL